MILPALPDDDAYWKAHASFDFGPALRAIAARHGVAGPIERFGEGGNVIAAAGGRVLKLFAPRFADEEARERAMLPAVAGRLPIPVPDLVAAGTLEDWPYLVLTRLPGAPLPRVWAALDARARDRLVRTLGEAMAALHALPIPANPGVLSTDWRAFLAGQLAGAAERHRGFGLPAELAEALPPFLAGAGLDPGVRPVMLHADFGHDNLLADPEGRLTGLIDFGDAMCGDPEYELITPQVFLVRGDPSLTRALLDGYGIPERRRDGALQRRLFAWTALHRFAHLPKYLRWAGNPEPRTLEAAERALWPLAPG